MTYHVPISPCPLLLDPPFVLLLVWLGIAIGFRCLTLLRVPLDSISRLERYVLCAALGLGLMQYLPFILGMCGRLTSPAVKIGMVLLLLVFGRDMCVVAGDLYRGLQQVRKAVAPLWMKISMCLLSLPLALVFLQALMPPNDPDGIAYHLTAPKRWLQTGRMDYLPTLLQTNAPMSVEMLYTVSMATWSDTAPKLIHYALGLLSLAGIFALGRRLKSPTVGFAAAALWLVGLHSTGPLEQFAMATVDLGITLQYVCAVLAWFLWQRTQERRWLVSAALYAGLAATCKLPGVFIITALTITTFWHLWNTPDIRRHALRQSASFAVVAMLLVLPWLCREWWLTGNPVYPTLSRLFPTRDWNLEADKALTLFMRYYNWGETFSRHFSLSQRVMICRVALLGTVSLAAFLYWRIRDREKRALLIMTTVFVALLLLTIGLYLRYFIPVLATVYLLLCGEVARRRKHKRGLLIALSLFLCLRALQLARIQSHDLVFTLRAATGRVSRESYLADSPVGLNRVWNYANAHVPSDAKILAGGLQYCGGYNVGASYHCDRFCFTTDGYLQGHFHMDTWDHFLSDVRRDHIGYVVCMNQIRYHHDGPEYLPERNEFKFVRLLVTQHGSLLFQYDGYEIYRLEDS